MFSRDSLSTLILRLKTRLFPTHIRVNSVPSSLLIIDKVSTRCVCVTVLDRVNVPSHSQASIDAPTHTSYGIHRNDFVES